VNHSRLSGSSLFGILVMLLAAPAACSGSVETIIIPSDDGGGADDGGTNEDGKATNPDTGNGGDDSSSGDDASGGDSNAPETSTGDSSAVDAGMDSGMMLMDSDGFGQARMACINAINTLRAMQSLPPYSLIDNNTIDTCIDEQATTDESMNSAHYSFINNVYPACSGFNAQDECEGYGNQVGGPGGGPHGTNGSGIVGCLYDMWAEQYNSNCTGCIGCQQPGGGCPNCDFYGMNGPECGHYVNMSASYFSMAACGFATGGGTWSTQNFQ
jgi:hypothetical protein